MVYHAARAPVIHGKEYNLRRDPVSIEVIGAVEQQLAAGYENLRNVPFRQIWTVLVELLGDART